MGFIGDKILQLSKAFYPTGRAFKIASGSYIEGLHIALSKSEEQAYLNATAILYSILPDNDNFTTDDATDWERRLGLITNDLVSLDNRKLAIIRKLNQPGIAPAKGNWRYLQEQLQAAGFNVYVYENRFPYYYPDDGEDYTNTPSQVSDGSYSIMTSNRYGQYRYGQTQYGTTYTNKVANSVYPEVDLNFDIGNNFRSTFFISGNPIGSFANIDINRQAEFRQLILRIKPVQTVAFLFVKYNYGIGSAIIGNTFIIN